MQAGCINSIESFCLAAIRKATIALFMIPWQVLSSKDGYNHSTAPVPVTQGMQQKSSAEVS